MEVVDEKRQDDYTQDGTVNLQGKPVLRSKTGGWKACSFIIGKITLSILKLKLFYFCLTPFIEKSYSIHCHTLCVHLGQVI
jgi:hypothetical protein